jgi:hypothetical protein
MHFDLDTEDGMNAAKVWTEQLLSTLAEGGTWMVPRSGVMVTVHRAEKAVTVHDGFAPDPAIARVIKAMGWKVKTAKETHHE